MGTRLVRQFLGLGLAIVALSANGELQRFAGQWVNVDPASRGISKVQIETSGEVVRVRVFGRCHPSDCDWGWVTGLAYTAEGVDAELPSTASAVLATYEHGYSTRVLVIAFDSPTTLSVESFTQFKDRSGRSNVTSRVVLSPL